MEEIAELLKETREEAGISLEEVSTDLNINELVLKNIEEGHIGAFKDIFEIRNYVFEYAKYLGLDSNKIIEEFNEYLFEYTSKIPVTQIEKSINKVQEDDENKIVSPYTVTKSKNNKLLYVLIYVLILFLVFIAIFWSINQVTVDKKSAYIISYRK